MDISDKMIDYFQLVNNIVTYGLLPSSLILPILVIIISFRVNFQVQASFLLYLFLIGSFLAGMSGSLCAYRHFTDSYDEELEDKMRNTVLDSLISKSQSLARTLLSTTSTSICIVKFFTRIQATRETVNNAGIGFFITMIFAKFCSVTILPDVKFYMFKETGQKVTFEMFELFECGVDIICLLSTILFILITCNKEAIVYPINNASDDQLPVTQPLNLPAFPLMTLNR